MTIQLTCPPFDKFDPDLAIQKWLKGSKHKRRLEFMDNEPKLKRTRLQTGELPVAGGEFMER